MPKCKSCGAAIEWVKMAASGKAMPVDPVYKQTITDAGFFTRGRESHFSTCPTAAEHRRLSPMPAMDPEPALEPEPLEPYPEPADATIADVERFLNGAE